MTRSHHQRRARSGRTAAEAAIVISVLFVLLMGIFEYGRLIMLKQVMHNAAREGARLAVVNATATSTLTTAQVQSYVTGYLAGQAYSGLAVQVYEANPTTGANLGAWTGASFGEAVAVQIDLDFKPAVPFVMPSTIHLVSRSMMLCEAN